MYLLTPALGQYNFEQNIFRPLFWSHDLSCPPFLLSWFLVCIEQRECLSGQLGSYDNFERAFVEMAQIRNKITNAFECCVWDNQSLYLITFYEKKNKQILILNVHEILTFQVLEVLGSASREISPSHPVRHAIPGKHTSIVIVSITSKMEKSVDFGRQLSLQRELSSNILPTFVTHSGPSHGVRNRKRPQ